jgi:serine/threonine protein phosphatase PrpC
VEPTVQVFWTPKKGNSQEEYEDAFGCAVEEGRFAIADGATESSFAEIWSTILTQKFISAPPEGQPPEHQSLINWVAPLQKEWHSNIMWDRLPWFAEEKARKGAFATFLGMEFNEEEVVEEGIMDKLLFMFKKQKNTGPRWRALTIGDSNMYQIRDDELITSWPLTKGIQFTHRPTLISSNPTANETVWDHFIYETGEFEEGDTFILATDAIAKWFLDRVELGEKPWHVLNKIKSEEDFSNLVAELRSGLKMQNDDTTIISIHWEESSADD